YTHSGHSLSVLYGFACLFLIGFLWAAVGGAATALPACITQERLADYYPPLIAVLAAWWVEWRVLDILSTLWPALRRGDLLDWYDTSWLEALVAPAAVIALAAVRRRLDDASRLVLVMAAGWWAGFLILVVGFGLRMAPPRGDNWAGSLGMTAAMLLYFLRAGQRPVV